MIPVAVLTLTFAFAAIYHPVAGRDGAIRGEVTRWLALMPVAQYALYLFVQYQDPINHQSEVDTRVIRPGREWAILALSLIVIVAGVEGLVRAAIRFGELSGTPGLF